MAGNRLANSLPSGVSPYVNAYKNSLFEEVEKQKSSYKKCFIHRLVYIAEINGPSGDDNKNAIAGHYEQFVSKIQKNSQTEGITGHLFIYPGCIVHLIETSTENLAVILKDLSDMEKGANPLLKDARVLVVSHCLLSRMFTSWAPQILTVTLSMQECAPHTEPEELLTQIYKLCTSIQEIKDNSLSKVAEQSLLMVEEGVHNLCPSSILRSPSEFLQTYRKPINILMDSEIMWPTQTRLYW
ncbi:hypothetical protein ACEWY4_025842 [Coilia grayii]|uniref:BLUF domain-containing protein n=1 Tax=Coilia grayii TaxID=363190 RepID=A0ABD1IT32_9TELE